MGVTLTRIVVATSGRCHVGHLTLCDIALSLSLYMSIYIYMYILLLLLLLIIIIIIIVVGQIMIITLRRRGGPHVPGGLHQDAGDHYDYYMLWWLLLLLLVVVIVVVVVVVVVVVAVVVVVVVTLLSLSLLLTYRRLHQDAGDPHLSHPTHPMYGKSANEASVTTTWITRSAKVKPSSCYMLCKQMSRSVYVAANQVHQQFG